MKRLDIFDFIDKVEIVDKVTGEIKEVTPDLVQVVTPKLPYKTSLDGHSSGYCDSEVNKGPYLYDDTGHVDLETLYKRSISQGVLPIKIYESELDGDTPLDDIDKSVGVGTETPNIEVPSPSGGTPTVNEPTVEQTGTTA